MVGPEPPPWEPQPDHVHAVTPDGRPYVVAVEGGTGYFVATSTGYAFCRDALVRAELARQWADLPTVVERDDAPPRPMQHPEIFARYGRRAERVIFSYTDSTRFVYGPDHGGELHVRVAVSSPPPPVRHAAVLEWLELAFAPVALDWLATVHRLAEPTCALVLLGPKGVGKSLFAHGTARYFGCDVADYDDVFKGRFNDALLRSPVVFLDEVTHGEAQSGAFRKLVANSAHAVEGKGKPTATLRGCPRLIVAANNPDPLRLGREELTRDDDDAIGARIRIIDCNPAAAAWLEGRGGRRYTADWVTTADGSPGRLPETIAWLRDHRLVKPGARFLVEGDATQWASRIATRTGLPAVVLDAIAIYLDLDHVQRRTFDERPPFWFHVPGVVLVSNEGLRQAWEALLGERAPTHRALTAALQRLSGQKSAPRTPLPSGDRPRLYHVPRSLVADGA